MIKAYRKTWTRTDLDNLRDFILTKEPELKKNLYLNILENNLRHRKSFHFFNQMSNFIGRTIPECKSKFQKYEKIIYEDYLSIPLSHFKVFLFLRRKRKIISKQKKTVKNLSSRDFIIPLNEVMEMNKLRKSIIDGIYSKKITAFLDDKTLGIFFINLIIRKS